MLARYPQIGRNLSQMLVRRLQELEERFRVVATERVARRLALALLGLLQQIGRPCDDGIQVKVTREELAQMTGTTLFTISRVLSGWSERGFIQARREAVIVSNPKRLKEAEQ